MGLNEIGLPGLHNYLLKMPSRIRTNKGFAWYAKGFAKSAELNERA